MQMKTPWHLWLFGVLSLAWNAIGCWSWQQQVTRSPAYFADMTMEQVAYVQAMPMWATVAYGLAVWAGLLGALMLLFRRRLAFHAYVAGLIGFIAYSAYVYLLSDGTRIMGSAGLMFSAFIFILCQVEVAYAYWIRGKGVLR